MQEYHRLINAKILKIKLKNRYDIINRCYKNEYYKKTT